MSNFVETDARLPRWGVVATVDEPAVLLAAWAAHHLAIGAAQVHLFHDRPNPQAEVLLAGLPGVVQYHSGDDGWRLSWRGRRPDRVETRQKYNATRVLREAGLDWVAHCDADEFILPERPLAAELASVQEKVWLKFEVDERCFVRQDGARDGVGAVVPGPDIFAAGGFRRHWRGFSTTGPGLYGDVARFLNHGCCGHTAGKSITRAGVAEHAIGVHYPVESWDAKGITLPYRPSFNARLLHFDGLTPLHYLLKMMRRALTVVKGDPIPFSTPRQTQFGTAARQAADPAALRSLWAQVQGINLAQAEALDGLGLWRGGDVPVIDHARALFPELDYSPKGFDRALLVHEAALIARARAELGFDAEALVSI